MYYSSTLELKIKIVRTFICCPKIHYEENATKVKIGTRLTLLLVKWNLICVDDYWALKWEWTWRTSKIIIKNKNKYVYNLSKTYSRVTYIM